MQRRSLLKLLTASTLAWTLPSRARPPFGFVTDDHPDPVRPRVDFPHEIAQRSFPSRPERGLVPSPGPAITVIGIGGAGSALLELVRNDHCCRVTCSVLIDSDHGSLDRSQADIRICHDAGPQTNAFESALSPCEETAIEEASTGADTVCVLAGLGGRTGSSVAAQIVALARQSAPFSVAVVTTPAAFEGIHRKAFSHIALFSILYGAMQCGAEDRVVYISNEDVLASLPKPVSIRDAHAATDRLIVERVRNIVRKHELAA